MASYLIVAAVAVAVSFILTPLVRRAALRVGLIDVPSDRKVHRDVTPLGGGVAILGGVAAAIAVAPWLPEFREMFQGTHELLGITIAGAVICAIGLADDRRPMQPTTKLAGQLIAAGILVLSGIEIVYFWFPGLGVVSLSPDLSALITILWAIVVMNAVNLIDGLDGLAAGVVAIAAGSLFVYSVATTPGETTPTELLMIVVVASCVGFLPFNFHPAKIFMGDAGAMLLGLLLASGTVLGFSRTDEPLFVDVAGFIVPVLLPVLILAVPLGDAVLAVFRRVRRGRSVMRDDKEHLHHRLYELFDSHRAAVGILYFWSALLASASVSVAIIPGLPGRLVAASITAVLLVSVLAAWRAHRRVRAEAMRPPMRLSAGTTREVDVVAQPVPVPEELKDDG